MVDRQEEERTKELSPEVWAYLKEHRFFGLAMPEEYGGHGFSALALSTIFGKLGTASMGLQSVVLIPNSVGPGELLLEVGTEEQRRHYLPRLARGEEIPCFALTEPEAGSDAASLSSRGELFRDEDGELRIRLDWEKRYITLAPVATLLGLAFRLFDPQNLLGKGEDLGITCALVPTDLPGVEVGLRHDPMGLPFPNGPTRGEGVVIAASQIIGGVDYAGQGWQMLMEALSGGRAISLPAGAAAGAKYMARATGAYATVRRQFGLSIGRFEGIEEPLARIGGLAYLLEAARIFTCGAIHSGHRPSVVSALMKYNSTELVRRIAIDAMDIFGGAGICQGPRNLVSKGYVVAPIGITVEGANILTRTLITFGQGALRCHPHAHALLEAIRKDDASAFRRAFLGQIGHAVGNGLRATLRGLTRGRLVRSPVSGPTAVYYRRLAWASTRFALYADLAMAALGGDLKRRGKLTGRFADMLSWMYLGVAVLRRFEAEGRKEEDLPLVHWGLQYSLHRFQVAFEGLLGNFDVPLFGALLRGPALWLARLNRLATPPSDRLGAEVAAILRRPGAQRDRLTSELHLPPKGAFAELEEAFEASVAGEAALAKVRHAVKKGRLEEAEMDELLTAAVAAGVIDSEERVAVAHARETRERAIAVDAFTLDELRGSVREEALAQAS
jgi:acyl-CoA dehydrogenase